jgi:hypothetical protein
MEVILVLRLGEPGALATSLAGLAASRLGAELLVMLIATVGNEIFAAAQASH